MPSSQRMILNRGHGVVSIQRTSVQRRLEHAAFSTKLNVRAHASSLPLGGGLTPLTPPLETNTDTPHAQNQMDLFLSRPIILGIQLS